jgi:Protein of unknown function (DUF4054)
MSAVPSGVVAFDWLFFSQTYPELISPQTGLPQAQNYFNEASLLCDNTPCSHIQDASVGGQRYILLHMLTAHIAALRAPMPQPDGSSQPSSPIVGRIFDATQGSVSVQTEMKGPEPGGQAWYVQTKYGAQYWQMTAQFRVGRYYPGHSDHAIEPYPWGVADRDFWGVY